MALAIPCWQDVKMFTFPIESHERYGANRQDVTEHVHMHAVPLSGKVFVSLYLLDENGGRVVWWKGALRDMARQLVPFFGMLVGACDVVMVTRNDVCRE